MFKTIKEAEAVTYTLSNPSKMPCYSYSIPAVRCLIGQKMRNVKGSVCASCYALKGFYVFKSPKIALEKRFQSLKNPLWVKAMTFQINKREKSGYFRWHDSGDLQGVWHLENIAQVARNLPHITFWLPTREYAIVSEYLSKNQKPDNLTIRLSGLMMDGKAPESMAKRLGVQVSGVTKEDSFTCSASKQDNQCKDCRACWNQNVFSISYHKH
jgi:hypothetical protein